MKVIRCAILSLLLVLSASAGDYEPFKGGDWFPVRNNSALSGKGAFIVRDQENKVTKIALVDSLEEVRNPTRFLELPVTKCEVRLGNSSIFGVKRSDKGFRLYEFDLNKPKAGWTASPPVVLKEPRELIQEIGSIEDSYGKVNGHWFQYVSCDMVIWHSTQKGWEKAETDNFIGWGELQSAVFFYSKETVWIFDGKLTKYPVTGGTRILSAKPCAENLICINCFDGNRYFDVKKRAYVDNPPFGISKLPQVQWEWARLCGNDYLVGFVPLDIAAAKWTYRGRRTSVRIYRREKEAYKLLYEKNGIRKALASQHGIFMHDHLDSYWFELGTEEVRTFRDFSKGMLPSKIVPLKDGAWISSFSIGNSEIPNRLLTTYDSPSVKARNYHRLAGIESYPVLDSGGMAWGVMSSPKPGLYKRENGKWSFKHGLPNGVYGEFHFDSLGRIWYFYFGRTGKAKTWVHDGKSWTAYATRQDAFSKTGVRDFGLTFGNNDSSNPFRLVRNFKDDICYVEPDGTVVARISGKWGNFDSGAKPEPPRVWLYNDTILVYVHGIHETFQVTSDGLKPWQRPEGESRQGVRKNRLDKEAEQMLQKEKALNSLWRSLDHHLGFVWVATDFLHVACDGFLQTTDVPLVAVGPEPQLTVDGEMIVGPEDWLGSYFLANLDLPDPLVVMMRNKPLPRPKGILSVETAGCCVSPIVKGTDKRLKTTLFVNGEPYDAGCAYLPKGQYFVQVFAVERDRFAAPLYFAKRIEITADLNSYVKAVIGRLGAEKAAARKKALAELVVIGRVALPVLESYKTDDPEIRFSLEKAKKMITVITDGEL